MSVCDPEKIVDREKELALVSEKVSRLARGEPFAAHERVIHFVGPSGIGKSCLLEKCHKHANDIEQCVPILMRFDFVKNLQGEFVENFLAIIDKEFSGWLKIPTQLRGGKTVSKYSSDLTIKINRYAENRIVILFLDEINILNKQQLLSIEGELLQRLVHSNSHLVLITAGRSSPSMFTDFALRPSWKNIFSLAAFDEITTGNQLEILRTGGRNVASKAQELGSGVPGNTTKLAAHLVGDPPSIPDELQAIQSLLADVKGEIEEHFHPVIEATCVLQAFIPEDVVPLMKIHHALGNQWSEASVDEMFRKLKQVQVGPGGLINWDRDKKGWTMDEPTRALFEKELNMRDPDLWGKLHCAAYQVYKAWGDEFNSQLYQDKAAYHLDRLQSAGMNCDGMEG